MKTMVFIDEEDPDAKEQEMYIIKKLGEGFQAVVYHVGLQGTNYEEIFYPGSRKK